MSVRITDTPQWAPGVVADPAKDGNSGSIPVTINKLRAMGAQSRSSSQQPGRDAAGNYRVHGLRQGGRFTAGGSADSRGALREFASQSPPRSG